MGYGGKGLNKYEVADKRSTQFFKGSVQAKVQKILKFLIFVGIFIAIVHPYLMMLGTQKSQSSEGYRMLNFQYSITDMDKILPVHEFMVFSKDQVEAKMGCTLKNDPAECHNGKERFCISKGITTMEYHQCIIKLLKEEKGDPLQFCKNHFSEMQIWTGGNSPKALPYHEMKYDCLAKSGVKLGADYCRDINKYTPKATKTDLFKCYRKYGVEFSEEYCDFMNRKDEQKLL